MCSECRKLLMLLYDVISQAASCPLSARIEGGREILNSAGISAYADALRTLARHRLFRMHSNFGRMVSGELVPLDEALRKLGFEGR